MGRPIKTYAFLFPGQGSQFIGMGRALAESYPTAMNIFIQAEEILGFPLRDLAWEGPESELNDTINTQPALLVHSAAALSVLREQFPELKPAYLAGHSMGEISALLASGCLDYQNALHLAYLRGQAMKAAGERSPGGMAAIIGLDTLTLDRICTDASVGEQIVQVANDNCPGQVVISGENHALERALQLAQASGARRVVPLAVSIAAHSPLMEHALSSFNHAVNALPLTDPLIPIVGNVSASPLLTKDDVRFDLQAQLNSRVRWTESIQYMIDRGVKNFIEIGAGSVLTGLLKRIDKQVSGFPAGTPQDIEKIFNLLVNSDLS